MTPFLSSPHRRVNSSAGSVLIMSLVIVTAVLIALSLPGATAIAQNRSVPANPISDSPSPLPVKATNPAVTGAPISPRITFDAPSASQDGGDRLVAMQYTDGSWGWPLTAPPTYGNILGPIAMGLSQAYRQTASASMLAAMSDAGTYLLSKTNNFSPSDGYLAAELDKIFGGTTYVDHVKTNFYDKLASGTYNRNGLGTLYTTASYVALISASRHGGGIGNLAAWDIGMGLYGAAVCGASTTAWTAGVKAEIDSLDGAGYYDVIGLAGAIFGLAYVGEDYDPVAGEHAAASNLDDLTAILSGYQISGGGFTWNSGYVSPGEETIQETGYSILALSQHDRTTYLSGIQGAADYMMSVQLGTGGWENYPTNGENNEVTGEALWGITVAYPPPVHNVTKDVYYSTIQGAVDNASSGNLITITAGTYEEQLEITKALTLDGAGTGSTVILSPTSLPLFFTSSADNYPVVYIHDATGITLTNLTVDGAGRGNSNYRFVGIGFWNAGGTVDGCEVKDIRDTPFSGAQHGVGILSWNNDGTTRTINVLDNTITGFQKNAMALNAGDTTPLAVTVDGNTITGAGPTGVTAQNGVQVWADLGTGEVTGNTISGIAWTGTYWVATSILNFYADVDIKGNTVTTAHMGIYNIDGAGEISGNDLTITKYGDYGYGVIATDPPSAKPSPFDLPSTGIAKKSTPGVSAAATTLTVDVLNNEVNFSGGDNTNTVGIEADAGYGPDDISFTASNNIVSGFETGFGLYECTSSCDVGVFTDVTLNDNSVSGSTYAIYSNLTSPTVDASGNWLGTNTPTGVASAVTGDVDYTPWLNDGTDTDLGTMGFQGDFSDLWVDDDSPQTGATGRIQEGIDMVTASTVNVAAGTYVEGTQVLIDKNVSIVGADKLTTIITPSANTSNSGDGRGWFLVNTGFTFNLSNVTLDGTGRLIAMGILNKGNGTIDNCRFMNIKYNESGPDYLGMGMSVRETPSMNVNVTNSEFSGMGRIGVHYRGPGITGTVSGNTFTGKGPGNWLDYAIEAGGAPLPEGGAHLTITDNTITNCEGVAAVDGSTSGGILVTTYFGPGTEATITGCTIMNNTDGIAVGYDGADASVVVAHDNIISGNTAYGVNSTNPYVDARYNYWGTLHGPSDPVGTEEVPKSPIPSVADAKNAVPAPNLGNAVSENVDYYPWTGPATGHANGGIWAGGYVNPTSNDVFMGIDAAALDAVDPMDTVAPPPPPTDYLYLYLLLDPGQPIENYTVDVKKDEASLATTAKGWDLRALTDHTSSTVNLVLPFSGLPSGFKATLYDLTTNDYANLSANPAYSYTSPGTETPSAFRILIGDSTEPAVAVSAPNGGEYLIVGTPYNVTWTSSDATGVLRHYIYYSLTGGAPYTLIDSTNGATFTYAWTPGSAAATASIKVTARDSVMNEETDISNSTFVILASNSIAYSAAAGWNLVSVPMLQGVMTPAAILGDDYGAPYFTFQFSPSSGYSIPATLNMGQGYWLGSNTAQAIDAVGTPLSSASLPLVSGFNIIGNPFATDMDVADLSFTDGFDTKNIADAASAGWLSNVLYGYGAGSYFIESTTLDLWNGYWVPMILDGITAEYTPTVGTPTPGTVPVVELGNEPNAWSVELSATFTVGRQAYGDRIAAFGVRPDARTGFDTRYDAPRPPRAPAEDYIELSFAGTDKAFSAAFGDAAYARKFQPVDNDGWEIVVTTSTRGEVALTWDNSSIRELGADLKVELYDPATHTSVDMKSASSYSFTQEGTERYLMVNRTTTGSAPASYELSQNYPNPFNPTTTIAYGLPGDAAVSIAVFNFLGQKVATLLTGETVQPAGYHEVVFDAATLSSGFYYYRINARGTDGRDFSDLRKMILLK